MGIVTGYPIGLVLFCLLLGAIYAFVLYFRTRKDEVSSLVTGLMSGFRFLSVSLISFLLLSPLVKKQTEITEKPLILVGQDNSASILLSRDSTWYRKEYPVRLKEFTDRLQKKFEVRVIQFGDRVSDGMTPTFSGSQTDISALFDDVNHRFANRNIGALVLASDGIYNKGTNPFYAAEPVKFPVFAIALGDTTLTRDLILKKTSVNPTAFLGDKFPVEISLEANRCANEKTEIRVQKGEEVLFARQLQFSGERDRKKINLTLDAKEKGLQRFTVTVTPVDRESTRINNVQEFYVEVTDVRQKMVLLYNSPHPDVFALKQALESPARYEVECQRLDEFTQPTEKYSVVILYQIPSAGGYQNLTRITGSGTSLFFILGTGSNLNAFNALRTGLVITSGKSNYTESIPLINEDFPLFTLDPDLKEMIRNVPPLLSPMGSYQHSPVSDILFYQKMGSVRTGIPLLLFLQSPERKTAILAGENLWRWRLTDYLQKGDHKTFDNLISKVIQYLSVKSDKSFFRIRISNRFTENENVELEAEVYNESYERINQDEVKIILTGEKGEKYPFVMGRTDQAYFLNAGSFPAGNYTYQATVKTGKNLYTKTGAFVITPLNVEAINTVADHNLLYRIAKAHDGAVFTPREFEELEKKILQREDIRPVFYTTKRFTELAGDPWLFLVILALLAGEWLMRKRSGVY